MRGCYTAHLDISGLSTSKTVMLIECTSSTICEILSTSITNRSLDTNEQLEAGLFRVTTKGSPAGTTANVQKHEVGDANNPLTIIANLTTEPTTYDTAPLDKNGFSNLAGYRYDPIPEERPIVSPSGLVGLRLTAAPAAAFDATIQITFRVIGG